MLFASESLAPKAEPLAAGPWLLRVYSGSEMPPKAQDTRATPLSLIRLVILGKLFRLIHETLDKSVSVS